MSDSNGFVYNPDGLNIETVQIGKEIGRKRIKECFLPSSGTKYNEDCSDIWTIKCDIALPSATENEIDEKNLLKCLQRMAV